MSVLCLAGGGAVVRIATTVFTLAWVHTIEKIPWEEDWLVTDDGLELIEARVKGSGAGMEPPPTARLEDGFYRWKPADGRRGELLIRRSGPEAGDWTLCISGDCRPVGAILPEAADPVRLYPCEAATPR